MFKTILSNASNVSTGDAWSEFEKQNLNDGADDNLDFDLEDFLTRHEFSQDFKTDHRNHYFKKADLYLNQDGIDKELFIEEQPKLCEDQFPFLDGDQNLKKQSENHSLLDDHLSLRIDQVVSLRGIADEMPFSHQEPDFITSDLPDIFKSSIDTERLPDDFTSFHQESDVVGSVDRVLLDEDLICYQKKDIPALGDLENNGSTHDSTGDDVFPNLFETDSENELHNFFLLPSDNFDLNENLQFCDDNQEADLLSKYTDNHFDNFETKPGISPDFMTIRNDCMLSSNQDEPAHASLYFIPRKHDASLTLSNNITNVVKPNVTMGMSGTTPPTLVTAGILEASLWTPINSSGLDEGEVNESDEEIDVVTTSDAQDIDAIMPEPLLHQHTAKQLTTKNSCASTYHVKLTAVKKLYLCNQQPMEEHNYFIKSDFSSKHHSASPPLQRMLTPPSDRNDRADFNPEQISQQIRAVPDQLNRSIGFNSENLVSMPSNVDKRKIVKALQSLLKKQKPSNGKSADNVKFKFRVKFKNPKSRQSILKSNHSPSHTVAKLRNDPVFSNCLQFDKPAELSKSYKQSQYAADSSKPLSKQSGNNALSSDADRFREIRDLHNSMERQRRIELSGLLDQLKTLVPEIANEEKASKLMILTKAAKYCRSLSNHDARVKVELERNIALRKKLLFLRTFEQQKLTKNVSQQRKRPSSKKYSYLTMQFYLSSLPANQNIQGSQFNAPKALKKFQFTSKSSSIKHRHLKFPSPKNPVVTSWIYFDNPLCCMQIVIA